MDDLNNPNAQEKVEKELTDLINRNGLDTFTNIPDYILASFLMRTIIAATLVVRDRDEWFGKKSELNALS